MSRDISPCGYRVLVRLKPVDQELEKKTESGIIIEVKQKSKIDREQRATQEAYVIKIGRTAWKAYDDGHAWCKEGDCVLIAKYSGDDLDDIREDGIYRVIQDRDILAVFNGEELC